MAKRSAGLLLHRSRPEGPEVLLVHPGGPLWARRDRGAWSIPKGEIEPEEEPRAAAAREFREELGLDPPATEGWIELEPVRQKGGKWVYAWAAEAELDPAAIRPGEFEIEWPPRSGRRQTFPEVDRAEWFPLPEARERILPAQVPLLEQLGARLALGE